MSLKFQEYVGNDGDKFWFLTNLDAPKHRIIEININAENRDRDSSRVIVTVSCARDILLHNYRIN